MCLKYPGYNRMNHSTSSKNYREARLFFSCQILNVGYILFFFHLVTHQHQFIFGNLEKILLKLKRDVLSLDEGWKYIMETHSL